MNTIRLVIVGCSMLMLLSCEKERVRGCTNPNSFNYNPMAEENDGSCMEMQGCLGFASGFGNSGNIGNSLGDPFWDNKMSQEVFLQRSFFNNIPANVYILFEPSPALRNAYATSDGRILFGYHMHYYTIQTYGELPVAGILAHEWGHRAQFTVGWQDYNSPSYRELEADAFSGFYMALAKQYAWSQIQSYYANVYATGDFNFNSPQHHGTPQQRVASAYLGVQTAVNAMQTNTTYTYNQLHNIFVEQIRSKIAPKISGSRRFEEIVYPNLNGTELIKLFPRL